MLPRLAILLAVSCRGGLDLDLPVGSDTQSAIVSFFHEDLSTEIYAIDLPDTDVMRAYDGRSRIEVAALLYPVKSCELMIRPGLLEPFLGGGELPLAEQIATTVVDGGSAGEWRTTDQIPSPLAGFLREVSPEICLECGCTYVAPGSCDCGAFEGQGPASPTRPAPPEEPAPAWTPPAIGALGECGVDSARWYGASECARVGSVCPAGRWPEQIPEGPRLYVDPTAALGGDGTVSAPFDRIDWAIAVSPPGTVIVLSQGVHPIGVAVFDQVTAVGACTKETVLRGNDDDAGVELETASLSNLRVERARIQVRREGSGELHDVVIDGAPAWGFFLADGAAAAVSNVAIRRAATGMELRGGSRFAATDLVIESSIDGVDVHGGSHLSLERVVIAGAGGIDLREASTATLTDVVLASTERHGIIVSSAELYGDRFAVIDTEGACLSAGTGARVRLEDVELSDCGGDGLMLHQAGADVELVRVRMQRSAVYAVSVAYPGRLLLEDLTISGSDGFFLGGADATVKRASIDGTRGVSLNATGGVLHLEDITSRKGRIEIHEGRLTVDRLRSDEGEPHGFFFTTGSVVLRDIAISQAKGEADFASAAIVDNATVSIQRMQIDNSASGLYAGTVQGLIEDLIVEDCEGSALVVFAGDLAVARARLQRNGAGALVSESAVVTFRDLSIIEVGAGSRDASGLDSRGAATISNFVMRDSSGYGARIVENGQLDLQFGAISGNAVGCGYPSGYDLERLTKNVRFDDNGEDLSPL